MKNVFAVASLCVLSVSLAAGQSSGKVEDQINKVEHDWAQAAVKDGSAAVDEFEADDMTSIDPTGRVTDKAQDKKDMSGDLKFQSIELMDLKIHVYGNSAVVSGTQTIKATYKDQDISGKYRYTDVWIKRNGKWQAVASQATKIQE